MVFTESGSEKTSEVSTYMRGGNMGKEKTDLDIALE